MKPRDYQQQLITGALELWRTFRRIAMVLGTGGGKTVIFSHIAGLARESGKPVLVLAHRRELIEQAADKLRQVNPAARIGIMMGTRKQWRAEVVVGSVQTCKNTAALGLLKAAGFGLIIIDECHHAPADSYVTILRELGAYDEGGPLVLGVTATLDRADNLALNSVFEEVVDPTIGLRELIKRGWLVPPRGIRVRVQGLDLSKVKSVGGDLDAGQSARALHDALAPAAIARAYLDRAHGRRALCFMPTVALSQEMAQVFAEHGVRAEHVDGTTPGEQRDLAVKRSREGDIDVLCNVSLFNEGTDMPWIDALILGQPTKSAVRYTQTIGRGVRLHPGKKDCVVLDVVGVTGKHRLTTLDNLDGAEREADLDDELSLYEDDWTEEVDEVPAEAEPLLAEPVGEQAPADPYGADGDLDHELVDLFGSAHASWLRTPGGTWFIAAGPQHFVFLFAEDDGTYHVQAKPRAGGNAIGLQWGMEIGYAMAWGEQYVEQTPMWGLGRDAKWREGAPGKQLIDKARSFGVLPLPYRRGMISRGELSDRVAVAEASAVLDA